MPSAPEWTTVSGADHVILRESGLFDDEYYRAHVRLATDRDPVDHYLRHGWHQDCQPNPDFPGDVLQPCFESVGLSGPAALTWLTLTTAGWLIPGTRRELEATSQRMLTSGLFDEDHYQAHGCLPSSGMDPATHYTVVGEMLGFSPSAGFDPLYYAERNPDVVQARIRPLLHYVGNGRGEARLNKAAWVSHFNGGPFDALRDNVIMVVHETSRTGAPILGWNIGRLLARRYNVYTVRMGDGELTGEFEAFSTEVHGPFPGTMRHRVDVEHSLRRLLDARDFRYAIVNSAESRLAVEAFASRYIPTLLLMHEFGSYVTPVQSLREAFDWAGEVVFPAPIVRRAAQDVHPVLASRRCPILPQGMSVVPDSDAAHKHAPAAVLEALVRGKAEGDFLVLGAGSVQIRKGVDIFLTVAAETLRAGHHRRVHFLWIGHGYNPSQDLGYSVYLREQLERSGLRDHMTFLDEVSDLEPFYALADLFLLTSRLDPLPNVSIDAALRGIPIVCFRDASGIADLMLEDEATAGGVVPHLDAHGAAGAILELASDEARRQRFGDAMRRRGRALFDMQTYVDKLDELGRSLSPILEQQRADAALLGGDGGFDQDMVLGLQEIVEPRRHTIARHLAMTTSRGRLDPSVEDTTLRRPSPGFNPRIWATVCPPTPGRLENPFAEFVRRGRPLGPWQNEVLSPSLAVDDSHATSTRAALHAHMFYPELADDLIARLGASRNRCDLFVTTDTPEKADRLSRSFASWDRGSVQVRTMPNRGRDLGPLLTGLRAELAGYDVVGHVHSKRSPLSGDATLGETWRSFLWENLVGGRHAMLDVILSAFRTRPELGLVFPSDPHLMGWTDNREAAHPLARRLGVMESLADSFDFPLGTMFWTARDVFARLVELDLCWDDYPQEPLPYDGTMLHALERLIPAVAHAAGRTSLVTHVPGVTW